MQTGTAQNKLDRELQATKEKGTEMTEPEEIYMDLWDCLAAIWRRWTGKK